MTWPGLKPRALTHTSTLGYFLLFFFFLRDLFLTITQTRPRPTWSVTVFQRITSPFAVATHTDSKSGKCCIPITQPLPSSGRYPSDTSETELTACRIKMKKNSKNANGYCLAVINSGFKNYQGRIFKGRIIRPTAVLYLMSGGLDAFYVSRCCSVNNSTITIHWQTKWVLSSFQLQHWKTPQQFKISHDLYPKKKTIPFMTRVMYHEINSAELVCFGHVLGEGFLIVLSFERVKRKYT